MKKITIGTLVGMIIFFGFQSAMWMGGFHNDFSSYTPNQEAILDNLSSNLSEKGLYMMPSPDMSAPDAGEQAEQMMKEGIGKPTAIVVYDPSMEGMTAGPMILGILYSLLCCLIACLVVYNGAYLTFGSRFLVSMSFSLFAIMQGPLTELNWWGFPWSFEKAQVMDLFIGWGLVSLWLGWYLKKDTAAAA